MSNHDREHRRFDPDPTARSPEDVGPFQDLRARLMQRRLIQRKANATGDAQEGVLPSELKHKFERSLGSDLGAVHVHTGEDAATNADALGARAYTTGQDIHFARGEFDPVSREGQELIAHEVAHTVQAPTDRPRLKARNGASNDRDEAAADRSAAAMVDGRPAPRPEGVEHAHGEGEHSPERESGAGERQPEESRAGHEPQPEEGRAGQEPQPEPAAKSSSDPGLIQEAEQLMADAEGFRSLYVMPDLPQQDMAPIADSYMDIWNSLNQMKFDALTEMLNRLQSKIGESPDAALQEEADRLSSVIALHAPGVALPVMVQVKVTGCDDVIVVEPQIGVKISQQIVARWQEQQSRKPADTAPGPQAAAGAAAGGAPTSGAEQPRAAGDEHPEEAPRPGTEQAALQSRPDQGAESKPATEPSSDEAESGQPFANLIEQAQQTVIDAELFANTPFVMPPLPREDIAEIAESLMVIWTTQNDAHYDALFRQQNALLAALQAAPGDAALLQEFHQVTAVMIERTPGMALPVFVEAKVEGSDEPIFVTPRPGLKIGQQVADEWSRRQMERPTDETLHSRRGGSPEAPPSA
jgi:hypothetical protein